MKKTIFTIITIVLFLTSSLPNISSSTPYKPTSFDTNHQLTEPNINQQTLPNEPFEGYTLYCPMYAKKTFLIDNNGKIVHTWKNIGFQGLATYLLENGDMIRSEFGGLASFLWGGGFTGRVVKYSWDGTPTWEFKYVNTTVCIHNDIEPLPNGNILMIVWERKSRHEVLAAGCNPKLLHKIQFRTDHIIEVKPTGPKTGEIVWEWHVWDHLIQEYDPNKNNYGKVQDHPELIDINYRCEIVNYTKYGTDFCHINAIDYHPEFDQILISARNFNEIWIIDHSTTTEEAAGHTGGKYDKGGDLLYRWGNPVTYQTGNITDQELYVQHDPRWIDKDCPGAGHITIFDNGFLRPPKHYSRVIEIVPPVDQNGSYNLQPGSPYGPEKPLWNYTPENTKEFYSYYVSGAQRLPNGNTLICSGAKGLFLEVTPDKQTVWQYTNLFPLPFLGLNAVFKINRYPKDYSGLKTPKILNELYNYNT